MVREWGCYRVAIMANQPACDQRVRRKWIALGGTDAPERTDWECAAVVVYECAAPAIHPFWPEERVLLLLVSTPTEAKVRMVINI